MHTVMHPTHQPPRMSRQGGFANDDNEGPFSCIWSPVHIFSLIALYMRKYVSLTHPIYDLGSPYMGHQEQDGNVIP